MFSLRKASDGTITFYNHTPYEDNPKHFTNALELKPDGTLVSYFSDPYERVTLEVKDNQVRHIFEWMANNYYVG